VYCGANRTKKDGRQSSRQRYRCLSCGKRFQYQKRVKLLVDELWHDYSVQKQTLAELAKKHKRSHVWVRNRLDEHLVGLPVGLTPQPTIIVPDTTFWGRGYGVMVFRSWTLRRNLWWSEVASERVANYHYGRKILESKGWIFTAAVIDGRRGLANVFKDIPVQMCQFHQVQTVTKYLTRRPKTEAGKELRALALTIKKTDEKTFIKALSNYEKKWTHFLEEKTIILGLKRPQYTHKNVRSALRSLKTNLLNLFTYLRYPELKIPNTTNTIDGYFASVKKKVAAHHGMRRDRRFKVISEILRRG
jgi:hypothetical protein